MPPPLLPPPLLPPPLLPPPLLPPLLLQDQVEAWKPITKAVHDKGSVFFAQVGAGACGVWGGGCVVLTEAWRCCSALCPMCMLPPGGRWQVLRKELCPSTCVDRDVARKPERFHAARAAATSPWVCERNGRGRTPHGFLQPLGPRLPPAFRPPKPQNPKTPKPHSIK